MSAMGAKKRKKIRAHETDDELDEATPISKEKRPKRQQTFLPSYTDEWQFLVQSKKGPTFVHCLACIRDFSCDHGGRSDCERHVAGQNHKTAERQWKNQPKTQNITALFKKQISSEDSKKELTRQVTDAEVCMVQFIAECNLPIATADRMTAMFQRMFPDSKIAKGQPFHFLLKIDMCYRYLNIQLVYV